jgi:hypothetical protein
MPVKPMPKRSSSGGAMSDKEMQLQRKKLPKKAMPMNYKNPKYKPSNGVGVGY